MVEDEVFIPDHVLHQVALDVNVLETVVKNWILGDGNVSLVVSVDNHQVLY